MLPKIVNSFIVKEWKNNYIWCDLNSWSGSWVLLHKRLSNHQEEEGFFFWHLLLTHLMPMEVPFFIFWAPANATAFALPSPAEPFFLLSFSFLISWLSSISIASNPPVPHWSAQLGAPMPTNQENAFSQTKNEKCKYKNLTKGRWSLCSICVIKTQYFQHKTLDRMCKKITFNRHWITEISRREESKDHKSYAHEY